MAIGKRGGEQQRELWLATQDLAAGPGHIFYDKLNALLAEKGFDLFVEQLCEAYYASGGKPSIPPGVYFRMLAIGYFEGLDSQRGIAWRCEDSLSLRRFLGVPLSEATPDHSSLTRIRDRLPLEVHEEVFEYILFVIEQHGLLKGKTVGVDSTFLEANAAMKSIVRKDNGDDWKAYLKRLMVAEGVIQADDKPTDDDLRKFDRQRRKQGKKTVSNDEWQSPSDPDSRIVRMKDGRTHLGYKAEHVVDLASEIILAATVHPGTDNDAETLIQSVTSAQAHLDQAGIAISIEAVAADKGYHANATLAACEEAGLRTYVPERQSRHRRTWAKKPINQKRAFVNNRKRMSRAKGKQLQSLRGERVERSFAHICETGGQRRTWLRGLEKINKRYLMTVAARNLGILMRSLFGIGTPRGLQGAGRALAGLLSALKTFWQHWQARFDQLATRRATTFEKPPLRRDVFFRPPTPAISTGC